MKNKFMMCMMLGVMSSLHASEQECGSPRVRDVKKNVQNLDWQDKLNTLDNELKVSDLSLQEILALRSMKAKCERVLNLIKNK
ncbi:hypothetical protein [Candidatus Chromulinivorax destructor]|uniref:DUF1090 family protein n=1 Tax=Candidatus Chromulinivorax destructor TaxID=2066483 RepID=A0A345ZCQ5_9BACT|nr:hypothetical protein [Candidatus Chromulinivorax destructor]AXK61072.1 hypothetical protein C0J27_05060 [Candidatus Chromulinivorax destructor]